ncbi:MAG: Crp/Fnr family transcriptional regulator [Pseudonocardiaceae bacterium]
MIIVRTPGTAVDERMAYPVLDERQRAAMASYGPSRRTSAGEVLFAAGDRSTEFHLVLSGTVEITAGSAAGPQQVRLHQPGEFTGDIDGFLTGRAALVTAEVRDPGEIVVLDREGLRAAITDRPDLADTVLQAFLSRRRIELAGRLGGVQVIGSRFSPDTLRPRRPAGTRRRRARRASR